MNNDPETVRLKQRLHQANVKVMVLLGFHAMENSKCHCNPKDVVNERRRDREDGSSTRGETPANLLDDMTKFISGDVFKDCESSDCVKAALPHKLRCWKRRRQEPVVLCLHYRGKARVKSNSPGQSIAKGVQEKAVMTPDVKHRSGRDVT